MISAPFRQTRASGGGGEGGGEGRGGTVWIMHRRSVVVTVPCCACGLVGPREKRLRGKPGDECGSRVAPRRRLLRGGGAVRDEGGEPGDSYVSPAELVLRRQPIDLLEAARQRAHRLELVKTPVTVCGG